jgi:toxin YoeB
LSESQLDCAFHPRFREELAEWVKSDRRVALKILELIENVMKNPFSGLGKPEPLKYLGPGIWSRRITQEHRLVYLVSQTKVNFLQCRYHY